MKIVRLNYHNGFDIVINNRIIFTVRGLRASDKNRLPKARYEKNVRHYN